MIRVLVMAALLVSCDHWTHEKEPTNDEKLRAKGESYLRWATVDEKGWIHEDVCDGLLFNSLYSVSGGTPDIELARGSAGVWYRSWAHDCFPTRSASAISRDMFAGLFLWIWKNKRLDLIEEIIAYGEAHTTELGEWRMGDGDVFRTGIRPDGQALAYEIRYKLGGLDNELRHLPNARFALSGYQEHLQILSILLWASVRGNRINDTDLQSLRSSVDRNPRNALTLAVLHRFTDGDQSLATAILMDETLFPSTRLPNNQDREPFYLWERDPETWFWKPGFFADNVEYSGVDFLFVKAIILGEI